MTPGPWRVEIEEGKPFVIAGDTYFPVSIAGVLKADGHQQENARLIATAPELLELCKDCEAYFSRREWPVDGSILFRLRAAIAKSK